ncbi:hypothetical protein E2C01_046333 [Portunus trituberculatus]|uniref:Uncharacterized protein n=1 Tax=Portunus trituberculatus TaxID=210409 RepID=A0A5B7G5H3_PORTR|nr:hypothetical protein [Portunus trituberculatus]
MQVSVIQRIQKQCSSATYIHLPYVNPRTKKNKTITSRPTNFGTILKLSQNTSGARNAQTDAGKRPTLPPPRTHITHSHFPLVPASRMAKADSVTNPGVGESPGVTSSLEPKETEMARVLIMNLESRQPRIHNNPPEALEIPFKLWMDSPPH